MFEQPAKPSYPIPSREEQFDFLVRCYFGEGSDLLRLCIHRAYLDFSRTLHGFASHKKADHLRQGGYERDRRQAAVGPLTAMRSAAQGMSALLSAGVEFVPHQIAAGATILLRIDWLSCLIRALLW
jgi:hypothetical protein